MIDLVLLALILGFVWGGLWAAFLQFTEVGRFLALHRTWLTVVVGVGVDLLILLLCVSFEVWLQVAGVVALSGVCIITRSLLNERRELREWIEEAGGNKDTTGQ